MVMWWPLVGPRDANGHAIGGLSTAPAIDTAPYTFECIPEDVEALNKHAIADAEPKYDITAISAQAYPHLSDRYMITASGGSFGENYGPKLVVKKSSPLVGADIRGLKNTKPTIAIPGRNTTAYLVLTLALGEFDAVEMPFMDIIGAVKAKQVDAGLLIHEAQLTFADEGLDAVLDLGAWWHDETKLPLPLGLNVIRADLDERFGAGTCKKIANMLGDSIRYAIEHNDISRAFLRARAGDRPEWNDATLLDRYLKMYVSDLTLDMGDLGRSALERLYKDASAAGLCPNPDRLDII